MMLDVDNDDDDETNASTEEIEEEAKITQNSKVAMKAEQGSSRNREAWIFIVFAQ